MTVILRFLKTSMLFAFLFLVSQLVHGQDLHQEKMEALNFLVGEWVGTTTIYEDGKITKQGAAFEKIYFDLDQSILVIELNTEFLQLRTIVSYDEKDERYKYHRFSKNGAAVYPAEFKDGELVVWRDQNTRFFFGRSVEGGFREYGERLVEGNWVKIFEDVFINTK